MMLQYSSATRRKSDLFARIFFNVHHTFLFIEAKKKVGGWVKKIFRMTLETLACIKLSAHNERKRARAEISACDLGCCLLIWRTVQLPCLLLFTRPSRRTLDIPKIYFIDSKLVHQLRRHHSPSSPVSHEMRTLSILGLSCHMRVRGQTEISRAVISGQQERPGSPSRSLPPFSYFSSHLITLT